MNAVKSFDDGTLDGGVQSANSPVQWKQTNNVTKTMVTSPRFGAGKRTMQALTYADLPDVFGHPVNMYTAESAGGYIYADMSSSSILPGTVGDITFNTGFSAMCMHACYHMVGKHVGSLEIFINGVLTLALTGEQVDPESSHNKAYSPAYNWRCFRHQSLTAFGSVTFRAIKGKGAEGDIAIDEVHFLENCHLTKDENDNVNTFVCPENYTSCGDGVCIRNSQLCNCQRNCLNNVDEFNCPTFAACGPTQFSCGGGCCVDACDKCDGVQDCPNNYDEDAAVCVNGTTAPTSTPMPSSGLLVSSVGEVYSPTERCNQIVDIVTGEDEVNCTCLSTEFSCGGRCLLYNRTCDRVLDCEGGEDEAATCPPCRWDQFTCDDQTCVPGVSLCNGTYECPDKSDEPVHQCGKACPLSLANLPSMYTSLVVGTPPATVAFGECYTLSLTCSGTWWSNKTSYNMDRWFRFDCLDSGAILSAAATMDVVCIPTMNSGFLPAGPAHYTDPVDFYGNEYVKVRLGFSPFGSTPSNYLKIKGKQVTDLYLFKNGFVSEVLPSTTTTAPTDYTFVNTTNLLFRDVFSVLSIDLDTADPGYIFFDQFNKPKYNDTFLSNYASATCYAVNGSCASMFDPLYAAVFTFHRLKDTSGNYHDAQLAFVADMSSTVVLFRYVTHPAVRTSNELGMLLMTTDFLRPDKIATSGNLMQHGTHSVNGDYLVEVAEFTTLTTHNTLLAYGTGAGDTAIELRTYMLSSTQTAAPMGGINVFDYIFNETAIVPAGGRVAFGFAGSTTYETSGCINSSLPAEQATFTAFNTDFSLPSSSGSVYHRFTTNSAELTKLKGEVCGVQTLIDCNSWNPTLAYVVTYTGIMINDGNVDFEGFGNTYQMIVVTDGTTTFGIVHYVMILEYHDLVPSKCVDYKGARLKPGFMRDLKPSVSNDKDGMFSLQFSKNATTNGAHVVFFDGFPCPISGNLDNFTLVSGYPDPLWTINIHPFKFLCNNGRGSPFDYRMGIPGPGRVLNPTTIECTAQRQGLPLDFNTAVDGFECREKLYYFGSEMGTGVVNISGSYSVQSINTPIAIKGISISSVSITPTGMLSGVTSTVSLTPSCQSLRGTAIADLYDLFVLFGVPVSGGNIFFDAFTSSSMNVNQQDMITRAKKEICGVLNEAVASCTFSPTTAIVYTALDLITAAPATPGIRLSGQIVIVYDASKGEGYVIFIYEDFADASTGSCTLEMGMLARTADLFTIPANPHTSTNMALSGQHTVEIANHTTYYIPDNFYTPLPQNILSERPASGSPYQEYSLTGGSLNVFDYTFSSFFVTTNQAALAFGAQTTDTCHPNASSITSMVDVLIMMVNNDVDWPPNVRQFIGDTTDSAVVNHFRDLACAAHTGLCPTWQPNRAVVHSILGSLTDDVGNPGLSGSWQVAIVTNGSDSYLVGTYGLETAYNRQASCGLQYRGASVNQKHTRFLDHNPSVTTLTPQNVWDAQFRNNTGKVGTWSVSLVGFPCVVSPWVPPGFEGVNTSPTMLETTESFTQTFTCTGGFGLPFDKHRGIQTTGSIKMNPQVLTCTPAVQKDTIGFNTSDGYMTDLTRFTCYPFYYCCSEAGSGFIPWGEFTSNGPLYVSKSLQTPLMINGEMFNSVRIIRDGKVTFRDTSDINNYGPSTCFGIDYGNLQAVVLDMPPVFSVLTGNYNYASGGIFMNQLQIGSSDANARNSLQSMSGAVNQYITGVTGFSGTYALVITYMDFISSSSPIGNNSAQLSIVTDGSDTFAIFKYAEYVLPKDSGGGSPCPQDLGAFLQSGDWFDIWSQVPSGSTPVNSGNAGNGTWIVQIGKRVARIPPENFFAFGTAAGDTKIDLASMTGDVTVSNVSLSPPFRVHDYNYDHLTLFTDGVMAFSFQNESIPQTFDACTTSNFPPVTGVPKQTTYFYAFTTRMTSIGTYGAIYYRNVAYSSSDSVHTAIQAKLAMEGAAASPQIAPIANPTRLLMITYHGIKFSGLESSVSFQVIFVTDGDDTNALFIFGPITEYNHLPCLGWFRSTVNWATQGQIRIVASYNSGYIFSRVTSDQFVPLEFDGFDCPLTSDTSHLYPFTTSYSFPTTIGADKSIMYYANCTDGFVFDYSTGYNTAGGNVNPQTVECPPYVQREQRVLPGLNDTFACLQTIYPCCDGATNAALDLTQFTSQEFKRQSVTMSNGFFWDGTKEDYIIIGKTGFLTVEPTVLTNNLESPKCVNKTSANMTKYLNYISLFGTEFNYTDAGGIFYQEHTAASSSDLFSRVSMDVTTFKGGVTFTPDFVMTITYMGVKDKTNGLRQNAQVAIAYDSTESYFIMLYDDYAITSTASCIHNIGLRTKSANAMDINATNVEGMTNYNNGRSGVYIYENRNYLTKTKDLRNTLFSYNATDDVYEIYKRNNPSSTLMDDTVSKYSISTLFSGSITTFNTFDHQFTHMGVGQGMIYFGDAPNAADKFPEAYCVRRDTGYLNITYIMLMGHDQNPEISPGALYIEVVTSGSSLLNEFDSYICPFAGAEYCTSPSFSATHGIIVTYQGLTGIDGEKYANTYQVFFGTNGTATFMVTVFSLITDYAAPDCFEYIGARPPKHLYRMLNSHITNATFDRQGYFDMQFFTNCPQCPKTTGVYVTSLDGFPCTWDGVLLGNFDAQMGCCGTTVRTTESINITHTCMSNPTTSGYIHKYAGTDQNPGTDALTCTPTTQGEVLSLKNITGYDPLFPYYCLKNFFATCCNGASASNYGTSSGWTSLTLTTNITIKGKQYDKAQLSPTGFLFFNESADIAPPQCYNFRSLGNRNLIPAFSLFSQDLQLGADSDSTTGRLYAEQLTTIPSELSMAATGVTNPTYALLISVVEAPLGSGGPRQSGQMALVANATDTDVIFKYEKYTSTNNACQVGAIFNTGDFLDIVNTQAKAGMPVAGSTHRMSIGRNVTNSEPWNMIPFLSHERIPYSMPGDPNKVLNDDRDVQRTLGSSYSIFGNSMNTISMTDNGYITLGTATDAFPDQFCLSTSNGYLNVAYLIGLNYDQKPESSTGAIFYAEVTSGSALTTLQTEICAFDNSSCNAGFSVDRAAIVTVMGSMAFDERSWGNTYQLIIATDISRSQTYGIIIYGVILGYRGDVDCEQFHGAKFSRDQFLMDISSTPYSHDKIYNLQFSKNAATTGVYVVRMYTPGP